MDLSVLNRRRSNIKGQITKLSSYLKEESDFSNATVTTKLDQFYRLQDKFEKLKNEYYTVAKEDEFKAIESSLNDIDSELDSIEVGIKSLLYAENSASNKNESIKDRKSVV